jgi:hypothetical protein
MNARRWRKLMTGDAEQPETQAWIHYLERTYPDRETLEATLDRTPAKGEPGELERLATLHGADKANVAALLGASLARSAERLTAGTLSRHFADVVVVASVVVLAMLPGLASRNASNAEVKASQARAKTRIEATHDLQPYVPLQAGDVEAKGAQTPTETGAVVAGVTGRYLLRATKAGDTVEDAIVSKGKPALAQFSILRVTLKAKPVFEVHSLPITVDVLLSARAGPPAGLVVRAELVDLAKDRINATLAIPDTALLEATQFLGGGDVYLALPVR